MGAECSVPCSAQNSFDKMREMELQQAREAEEARANEPGGRKWYERKGAMTGRCIYQRMRARRLPRAMLSSRCARPVARARERLTSGPQGDTHRMRGSTKDRCG